MRLHIVEKMNMVLKQQKSMLASGEKYRPLIENRVQRIAVHSIVAFFTLIFVCTIISRISHSFTTASIHVATLTSGALTDRAEAEGTIQAASDRGITLPEGLKVVAVKTGKGSQVNAGDALLEFDVSSIEEQAKKLEDEIRILQLKIELSGSEGGNDVITAQRNLEDARQAYHRLSEKYARQNTRLQEDYSKLEEKLAAAETRDEKAVAATRQDLIDKAEAVVKEAKENLEDIKDAAEEAIYDARRERDDASDHLDASREAYQELLEAYNQAERNLNDANQAVNDIKEAIAKQEPGDTSDYTEELNAAKEELSNAKEELKQAKKELSGADYKTSSYDSAADNLDAIEERWDNRIERARDTLRDARAALTKAKKRTDFSDEAAVIEAQAAIEAVKDTLTEVRRESEDNWYQREEELYEAQRAIEAAQIALENAQKQTDASQKEDEITRITCGSELAEKEKAWQLLREMLAHDGQLLAPASGTVLSTVKRGAKTAADEEVVTLSCDDRGFVFEGVLDKESAQHFIAGDKGELSFQADGSTQKIEVAINSVSTSDEEDKVFVSAILPEGSYSVGLPAQLSLSRKSETYQSCLPITALRTDSRGDHVLVIRRQNSVMGTEWVTARIDINVKDRDSKMMSVESALTYSDQVITSSNKAIAEGDRVRIEN